MLVPILFFCSGASALIYELVWSRYLTLLFGSTVQAQTVVLAVFMGGLALGNRLFGGFADRSRSPLAAYGYVEVVIGLYAFFFNQVYAAADWLFLTLGAGWLDRHTLLLILKGVLSVLLLLGPTILMGGTLPLLAAWLQRRFPDAGRWSARFYSINSLGAVFGSFLAGFVLVQELGMESSLQMTALLNVVVGFVAVGIARMQSADAAPTPATEAVSVDSTTSAAPANPGAFKVACALVAVTGAVSMGLEVLSSRSLILVVGGSLQAFAIVLMAFILGIGLGSAAIASPKLKHIDWGGLAIGLLVVAAAWIGILVAGIENWVLVYFKLRTGLGPTDMGYVYYQLLTAGLALMLLGVPAGLIGAVLPVCMRTLAAGAAGLGGRVGRLLTWNTLGAVVGALLAGFFLMPFVGLRTAFFVEIFLLCGAAALLSWQLRRWRSLATVAVVGVVMIGLGVSTGERWKSVLSSGLFRFRGRSLDPDYFRMRDQTVKLLYYRDGTDATVSVEEVRYEGVTNSQRSLRVNGKADATTRSDYSTQVLIAHLGFLARPEAKDVFVLGMGSGMTAAAALSHPINKLVVAENCRPVLEAVTHFDAWNRGVLKDPRIHVLNDDGRTILKLGSARYDLIINEPSNPWMVGVGSVFSREYYQLCASRLKPGGLVTQWFHCYEMNDQIVAMVVRTFSQVFPHFEIWDTNPGDLVLVGSLEPWKVGPGEFETVYRREQVRQDFDTLGLSSPALLWSRQLASQRTAFAIPGDGAIQTDAFPILEYVAPRSFYIGASSTWLVAYDERTWQKDLLPSDKRDMIKTITDEVVRKTFREFGTVNAELRAHLQGRSGDDAAMLPGRSPFASSFASLDTLRNTNTLADLGDKFAPLWKGAEQADDPQRWREGVTAILDDLDKRPKSTNAPADRLTMHYLTKAAVISHDRQDAALTSRAIEIARKLEPSGERAGYLQRVFEREASRSVSPASKANQP